jgi:hypothetical protein
VGKRAGVTYNLNPPVEVLRQIRNDRLFAQIRHELRQVALDQRNCQWDLAGDLEARFLLALAVAAYGVARLPERCKRSDMVRRHWPKSDIVFLHSIEKDVDRVIAACSVSLGFDVHKPFKILIVWRQVPQEWLLRSDRLLEQGFRLGQCRCQLHSFSVTGRHLFLGDLTKKCRLWEKEVSCLGIVRLALTDESRKVRVVGLYGIVELRLRFRGHWIPQSCRLRVGVAKRLCSPHAGLSAVDSGVVPRVLCGPKRIEVRINGLDVPRNLGPASILGRLGRDPRVGIAVVLVESLPDGEETVDVAGNIQRGLFQCTRHHLRMMQPKYWVKCRYRRITHVAASTTGQAMHGIVRVFQTPPDLWTYNTSLAVVSIWVRIITHGNVALVRKQDVRGTLRQVLSLDSSA